MTRLCRCLSVTAVGALLLAAGVATRPTIGAGPQAGAPCTATLSVSETPHLVPAHVAWESIFDDIAAGVAAPRGMGVFADEDRLKNIAKRAVERTREIRSASESLSTHGREVAAAAAVLEFRDTLLRDASVEAVDALATAARGRANAGVVDLGVEGRTVATPDGMKCSLVVHGREYPHLIPEAAYWRDYFSNYASTSDQKDATGTYKAEFLAALRRHHMNIPRERLLLVLQTAENTYAALRSGEQGGATSADTAEIVMAARTLLLRTLTPAEWSEVQKDAARIREGSFIRFFLN
jgi:hypothetical protein